MRVFVKSSHISSFFVIAIYLILKKIHSDAALKSEMLCAKEINLFDPFK
jgi:hypothetical protein